MAKPKTLEIPIADQDSFESAQDKMLELLVLLTYSADQINRSHEWAAAITCEFIRLVSGEDQDAQDTIMQAVAGSLAQLNAQTRAPRHAVPLH